MMQNYQTKQLNIPARRKENRSIELMTTTTDLRAVADFVKETGLYIEDLEERIGEDLIDFWQTREHSLRILTDWMMQAMEEPLSKAA